MADSLLSSPPRLRGSPSPPLPSSGRGRLGALGTGGGSRQSRDARKGRSDVITGLWGRGFDYLFPGVAPTCGAESLRRKSPLGRAAGVRGRQGKRHLLTFHLRVVEMFWGFGADPRAGSIWNCGSRPSRAKNSEVDRSMFGGVFLNSSVPMGGSALINPAYPYYVSLAGS